jgi:hypothetical protein
MSITFPNKICYCTAKDNTPQRISYYDTSSSHPWKRDSRNNKNFWEEGIACLPLIRHRSHRNRHLQQFFVAVRMCLPNRCPSMIRRRRDPQTLLWHDTGHTEHDTSNKSSVVACIDCRGKVFTEPLPSNHRETQRSTDSPLTRHGPHGKRHVQQVFSCCQYSLSQEGVYRAVA